MAGLPARLCEPGCVRNFLLLVLCVLTPALAGSDQALVEKFYQDYAARYEAMNRHTEVVSFVKAHQSALAPDLYQKFLLAQEPWVRFEAGQGEFPGLVIEYDLWTGSAGMTVKELKVGPAGASGIPVRFVTEDMRGTPVKMVLQVQVKEGRITDVVYSKDRPSLRESLDEMLSAQTR